jgi:hypothetical protein
MDAAQFSRRAIGEVDGMGAAQQLQQRAKPDGLIIGMGDHERDRRIHDAARAQIAHDVVNRPGDRRRHGLTTRLKT